MSREEYTKIINEFAEGFVEYCNENMERIDKRLEEELLNSSGFAKPGKSAAVQAACQWKRSYYDARGFLLKYACKVIDRGGVK